MAKTKQRKAIAMIRLDAGHDSNGNPRRMFVALGTNSDILGAWDEGYDGFQAVPLAYRKLAGDAPTFATTPGEYRVTLQQHGGE